MNTVEAIRDHFDIVRKITIEYQQIVFEASIMAVEVEKSKC